MEVQDGKPNRKVYALADSGRQELIVGNMMVVKKCVAITAVKSTVSGVPPILGLILYARGIPERPRSGTLYPVHDPQQFRYSRGEQP